jgi:glycogen operon protein
MTEYKFENGQPLPLGAIPDAGGVGFSVFAEHATSVTLLLFDTHDQITPTTTVQLSPVIHKRFHFWSVYVRGLEHGAHYAYRVDGPPQGTGWGHRYDVDKVLIDPHGRGVTSTLWDRGAACGPGDNLAKSMRSVVIDISDYDWEGDQRPGHAMQDSIIYEMHVGGFTKSPTSGVAPEHSGKFAGVIEKIPYLKDLGVTAVELLPVFDFDSSELNRPGPDGTQLTNYWGYSTDNFFAPHDEYCVSPELGSHIQEFRDMVKALHKAGIEVILDVVFNHTTEGNHEGPTLSFKGFDNRVYYHLTDDGHYYMDYSGCGNTIRCSHPLVAHFIIYCLEFWAEQMHVDGFRFDEGTILCRGEDGAIMQHPPVIWQVELSRLLADVKVIAEAWDAAGAYEVGVFPGYRWAEWNGQYRDVIRRFVKGDAGIVGLVASRLAGSSDLYQRRTMRPVHSINFVTVHDGFTLNDLVSYNEKHNEANGEDNNDGNNDNLSWNCGVEGETTDPVVDGLRRRQIKNFMAILMVSQGVPLFVAGDEFRRTQQGNNNAYCHDTALNWMDWTLPEKNAEILRFTKGMIAFRMAHAELRRGTFFDGTKNDRGLPDITWHGCALGEPGWSDPGCRVLAFTLGGVGAGADLHVILNMESSDLDFAVPEVSGRSWLRVVDTAAEPPLDMADEASAPALAGLTCRAQARSVVVLVAR